MNSKIISLIFFISMGLLFFVSFSCILAAADDEELEPGVSACGSLAISEALTYAVNIVPDVSMASFALNWRNDASKINLDLQTPGGEWIRPKRDSDATYKESNTSKTYSIERPVAGRWIAKVSHGNASKVNEDYCITAHIMNIKSEDKYAARFSGLYSDYATDEDKDGIADYITIEASVSV